MAYLRILLFFGVMFLYLWFPFSLIQNYEEVLEDGEIFQFQPEPLDPYDAFKGRYIRLFYNIPAYPNDGRFQQGQQVFVELKKDSTGFARFDQIYPKKPVDKVFVETTIRSVNKKQMTLEVPINMQRYYLNERMAPLAEQAYQRMTTRLTSTPLSIDTRIDVRIHKGQVVIEEVYFEGLPLIVYLQKSIEEPF